MKKKEVSTKSFLIEVGEKIKHYREQRGLSLDSLGSDIGLEKANMFKIEAGKNITLATLVKLAVILKVKPEDLVSVTLLPTMEEIHKELILKEKKRKKKKI